MLLRLLALALQHYVNMLGKAQPGGTNGSYYAIDVGLIHFVFLSSEVIALGPYGAVTVERQSAWLQANLAAVNRTRTPWVVAVHHRPLYCSNANSWCTSTNNPVRDAFEAIFLKFGVDVVLAGHEHSVELTWPVANGTTTQQDYNNPRAPVHITDGAAGCNENKGECLNPMGPPLGDWSRARLAGDPVQYGYGRLWATNASHFHFEHVQSLVDPSPSGGERLGRAIWPSTVDITQTAHGPFMNARV